MRPSPDPERERIASAALREAGVHELVASGAAIVLERIAHGAGMTNWYRCADATALAAIARRLSPGSVVSFYFDGRIRSTLDLARVRSEIERILDDEPDGVAGVLGADGVRLDVEVIVSRSDLDEYLSSIEAGSNVYFGRFPGRDNDGVHAVTLTMPDRDGIVRGHAH